jgi:uncharacterized protein YggE
MSLLSNSESMPRLPISLTICACLALLAFAAKQTVDLLRIDPRPRPVLTVSETGQITTVPDQAILNVSAFDDAPTPGEVQTKAAERANRIRQYLTTKGITAADIQTSNYQLEPQYFYGNNQPPKLTGYRLNQGFTITAHKMEKIGEWIAGLVEAGANQVGSPQFSVSTPEKYENEARKKAFELAKAKAQNQADVIGRKLGRLVGYREGNSGGMSPRPMMMKAAVSLSDAGETAPPIDAGTQKVSVTVTLEFQLD